MTQSRKETAWRKSRKFGDVKGGRKRPKIADNVFNRQHNFLKPASNEIKPVIMLDNPSRDFFFPVAPEEVITFLKKLPDEITNKLTHLWFRKVTSKDFESEYSCQASFICGSGVNLITIYPFPADLKMRFGNKKPQKKIIRWYQPFEDNLVYEGNEWFLQWTEDSIKKYYLEGLMLHELGHLVDSYLKRFWSKPFKKSKAEKFADNFSIFWGSQLREVYS